MFEAVIVFVVIAIVPVCFILKCFLSWLLRIDKILANQKRTNELLTEISVNTLK